MDPVMVNFFNEFIYFSGSWITLCCIPGITAALASSYLCANSAEASVSDCFWSNDVSQGISVTPKQLVFLNPFITFPQPPGVIPFKFGPKDLPESSNGDVIYTLIETDFIPADNQQTPMLEVIFTQNHKFIAP
jgi:hypothetical protein